MKLLLVLSFLCLVAFIVAWVVVGQVIPFWQLQSGATTRGAEIDTFWPLVQNVSAVLGILSFVVQMVGRRG